MSRVRTVKKCTSLEMNLCSQDADLLDVSHTWSLTLFPGYHLVLRPLKQWPIYASSDFQCISLLEYLLGNMCSLKLVKSSKSYHIDPEVGYANHKYLLVAILNCHFQPHSNQWYLYAIRMCSTRTSHVCTVFTVGYVAMVTMHLGLMLPT